MKSDARLETKGSDFDEDGDFVYGGFGTFWDARMQMEICSILNSKKATPKQRHVM